MLPNGLFSKESLAQNLLRSQRTRSNVTSTVGLGTLPNGSVCTTLIHLELTFLHSKFLVTITLTSSRLHSKSYYIINDSGMIVVYIPLLSILGIL